MFDQVKLMFQPTAIDRAVGARIRTIRTELGVCCADLAEQAKIPSAVLREVEEGLRAPTAHMILGLCNALNIHPPELFADETPIVPTARRADQQVWRDDETGLVRRALSPAHGRCASNTDLVEITLPAGVKVDYGLQSIAGLHWHFWILEGALTVGIDDARRALQEGDCSCVHSPCRLYIHNETERDVRYLMVFGRN